MVMLACVAVAPVRAQQVLDRVLAVVAGNVITLSDARAAMALGLVEPAPSGDAVASALQKLIDRRLVLEEAARMASAEVDAAQVDARVAQVVARFGSREEYLAAVGRLGLDEDAVRGLARDVLIATEHLDRRFAVVSPASEDELRARFAAEPSRYSADGLPRTFDAARDDVRVVVEQERRRQAIDSWLAGLRRRADISTIYAPPR
jgi:parvulin-like peptidyl-prolyl isomerase